MPNPVTDTSLLSNADLLARVRRCMAQIVSTGQSYELDGAKKTEADLEALRKLEADLAARVAEENSGAPGSIKTWQVVF